MDYDLVIVSHNAKDCLVKCIESLKLVAPKKVIV
jgi:hypothetical protein